MVVGFSLSPGGLLLPYHLGVLAALRESGRLDKTVPIAGSSVQGFRQNPHGIKRLRFPTRLLFLWTLHQQQSD